MLVDLETDIRIEVNADYVAREYQQKIAAHIEALRDGAQRAGMSYQLLVTDRPLDGALREYLTIRLRGGPEVGFLAPAFLFGALAVGVPLYLHLLRRNTSTPLPFSSLMFFERRPQSRRSAAAAALLAAAGACAWRCCCCSRWPSRSRT